MGNQWIHQSMIDQSCLHDGAPPPGTLDAGTHRGFLAWHSPWELSHVNAGKSRFPDSMGEDNGMPLLPWTLELISYESHYFLHISIVSPRL